MKLSYSQTRKIVKTSLIVIILLIILSGIYYFVVYKSPSKDQTHSAIENSYPIITRSDSDIGFCFANTLPDAKEPYRFFGQESFNTTQVFFNADNGIQTGSILNKWEYDTSNSLSIERTINNTNNIYTQDELSALGKTDKPNTYLVNKLIPLYDKNDPKLQGIYSELMTPWVLSLYSNCK